MRRSRMLSDDARLAQQLQDEELRAGRGMKRVKIDLPSGAAAKKAKDEAIQKAQVEAENKRVAERKAKEEQERRAKEAANAPTSVIELDVDLKQQAASALGSQASSATPAPTAYRTSTSAAATLDNGVPTYHLPSSMLLKRVFMIELLMLYDL